MDVLGLDQNRRTANWSISRGDQLERPAIAAIESSDVKQSLSRRCVLKRSLSSQPID
jgi:hypothetical protein